MIPIALKEWGNEYGVASDTPNGQLDKNRHSLRPDPRRFEGQNVEGHEDQGLAVRKFIFENDQLGEDSQVAPGL